MKNKGILVKLVILILVTAVGVALLKAKAAVLLNNIAVDYSQRGELNRAISFFQYSLRLNPNEQVRRNLAQAYQKKQGDAQRVDQHQTQINSLFNQAGDLYLQGNKIEAEEKLQKLIGQSPDFALAYKLLGDLKFDARLFKAAIANYEQALELGLGAAAFYNLYNDIGISYMRLEEYAQAVKYLKQALELEPDNLGILYNLACVLRDNGDYPEATARYQELIEQRFDFPNVHNDLGDIYQLSGQEQLAQEQYSIELANAQLADNPETLENLNRLALAYNGLGQYAQAKEIIGRAIESSLDDGEALYTRARILENLGDNQGAIKDLQKAKQFFSGTKFIDNYIIRLSPGAD